MSPETSGGDRWYDNNTSLVTSTAAVVVQSVYGPPNGGYTLSGGAGNSYVPVDFQYVYASTAPPAPVIPVGAFVRSESLGSRRNDYSGWVGFKFTVGPTPVKVNQLGRIFVSGITQTHAVKLVDASGFDLPGASVVVAGGVAGQYTYAPLSSPVTLAPNGSYYLMSAEISGGDAWYDNNTTLVTSTAATVNQSVYGPAAGGYTLSGGAGNSYVPVDFQYVYMSSARPCPSWCSATDAFVRGKSLGSLRNNYSGWVGFKFTWEKRRSRSINSDASL